MSGMYPSDYYSLRPGLVPHYWIPWESKTPVLGPVSHVEMTAYLAGREIEKPFGPPIPKGTATSSNLVNGGYDAWTW